MLKMSLSHSFCLIFLFATLPRDSFQCVDEAGNSVDWYVLYKLPMIKNSQNFLLRHGLAYMYITSKSNNSDWVLSEISINDTKSIPARTLAPIYGNKSSELLFFLYNDDPPSSAPSLSYGHTKGAVLASSKGGIWLVHSVPNFPIEPVDKQTSRNNKYFYPSSATKFGQSFLCMSLPSDQLDILGNQLMFNKPKIYTSNIPESLAQKHKNLTLASKGQYVRNPPWNSKAPLKSIKGVTFVSYAKASRFGKDLYVDWLASDLASDLQVETWSNGGGEMPSDCRLKYHVMDVTHVGVKFNSTPISITFKNSQDHSKWATSISSDVATICIGDINRMTAQLKRGGGTVCIKNAALWKRYSKIVTDVQPCKQ